MIESSSRKVLSVDEGDQRCQWRQQETGEDRPSLEYELSKKGAGCWTNSTTPWAVGRILASSTLLKRFPSATEGKEEKEATTTRALKQRYHCPLSPIKRYDGLETKRCMPKEQAMAQRLCHGYYFLAALCLFFIFISTKVAFAHPDDASISKSSLNYGQSTTHRENDRDYPAVNSRQYDHALPQPSVDDHGSTPNNQNIYTNFLNRNNHNKNAGNHYGKNPGNKYNPKNEAGISNPYNNPYLPHVPYDVAYEEANRRQMLRNDSRRGGTREDVGGAKVAAVQAVVPSPPPPPPPVEIHFPSGLKCDFEGESECPWVWDPADEVRNLAGFEVVSGQQLRDKKKDHEFMFFPDKDPEGSKEGKIIEELRCRCLHQVRRKIYLEKSLTIQTSEDMVSYHYTVLREEIFCTLFKFAYVHCLSSRLTSATRTSTVLYRQLIPEEASERIFIFKYSPKSCSSKTLLTLLHRAIYFYMFASPFFPYYLGFYFVNRLPTSSHFSQSHHMSDTLFQCYFPAIFPTLIYFP